MYHRSLSPLILTFAWFRIIGHLPTTHDSSEIFPMRMTTACPKLPVSNSVVLLSSLKIPPTFEGITDLGPHKRKGEQILRPSQFIGSFYKVIDAPNRSVSRLVQPPWPPLTSATLGPHGFLPTGKKWLSLEILKSF